MSEFKEYVALLACLRAALLSSPFPILIYRTTYVILSRISLLNAWQDIITFVSCSPRLTSLLIGYPIEQQAIRQQMSNATSGLRSVGDGISSEEWKIAFERAHMCFNL